MELKNVQNIIHDNMMSYSNYVITNRALPDIRDGLKPSYRRILVTMDKMNITAFTKSQNVSGQTMKIHPHGDCYPTIVGMVQPDNNITPWIKGKGSFGQHTSKELQAAAPRYTEICLSNMSKDIFKDINKSMVEFIPNYDGTIMMPEVLPVKYPSILHYAQSGIAVGMSCNLPSHNLKEINDATKYYVLTGSHGIIIPDFATGGEIVDNPEIFRQICEEGTGTIRLRAKSEIIGNVISIKEIPYTTTREAIIEQIIKLIKGKKIETIANVQDLTGLEGMEIEITAKRNTDMKKLLAQLYKWTPMESTLSVNMNILVNKLPKVLGTHKIIEEWVVWRRECIRNGIRYELENLNERLHNLLGLQKILLNIDKAIEIIRHSQEDEIDTKLMEEFEIDRDQAEYVSNMKLKYLNKDVIIKRTNEIDVLKGEIDEKEIILNDDSKINEIVVSGLDEMTQKYGEGRRTKIVTPNDAEIETVSQVSATVQQQSEDNDTKFKVILTEQGYFKKLLMNYTNTGTKEVDRIVNEFVVTNKSEIGIFSGTDMYKLYINQYDVHSESDFGVYLPTAMNVTDIKGYTLIDDSVKFTLIVYDNMKVAKIENKAYRTASRRTKLENSLFSGANVIEIITLLDDTDLEVMWKNEGNVYNTSNIRSKASRASQGVTLRNEGISVL